VWVDFVVVVYPIVDGRERGGGIRDGADPDVVALEGLHERLGGASSPSDRIVTALRVRVIGEGVIIVATAGLAGTPDAVPVVRSHSKFSIRNSGRSFPAIHIQRLATRKHDGGADVSVLAADMHVVRPVIRPYINSPWVDVNTPCLSGRACRASVASVVRRDELKPANWTGTLEELVFWCQSVHRPARWRGC
jgi:hypothetical protein